MSLLAELECAKGSTKKRKRLGRGMSSGRGGTSTKGHKGQKARSGGGVRWNFEGGQMPLTMRIPKFGFNSRNPQKYQLLNLKDLTKLDGEVSPQSLGLKATQKLKILADGEITKGLTVKAHKFSAKAKSAIEAAGGTVEEIK